MGTSGSIRADGKRAKQLRDKHVWNVDEVVERTHYAVERLSKRELESGRPGRFTRRLKRRAREEELAGLAKSTIYAVERGRNVSRDTLKILAETYGVTVSELAREDPPSGAAAPQLAAAIDDLAARMGDLREMLDSISARR
jgi:transcriptional regulator with XRE-family HTH domain